MRVRARVRVGGRGRGRGRVRVRGRGRGRVTSSPECRSTHCTALEKAALPRYSRTW